MIVCCVHSMMMMMSSLCCFCCLGDADLDLHFHHHGGFPSLLRAYHTRPAHHQEYDPSSASASSAATSLPLYHPLLIRHADHPQQQSARALRGANVQFEPLPPAETHYESSAMQQLLSNISAAAGSGEVLGFRQRTRGTSKSAHNSSTVKVLKK